MAKFFCTECGNELHDENLNFCDKCGAKIEKSSNNTNKLFCHNAVKR